MVFAIFIFFILIELLFSLTSFKSFSISLKKNLILTFIPLGLFILVSIYLFIFNVAHNAEHTYLFFLITFYLLFFIPKLFYTLSFFITSIPLVFRESIILKKIRKWLSVILLLISFIYLILAIFWGSRNLVITYRQVKVKHLPSAFNHLKIVQISDLHLGSIWNKKSFLTNIVNLSNNQNPDIVVFTGDLVNQYCEEIGRSDTILKKLKANIGKFAILGNHDFGDYSLWKSPSDKKKNLTNIIKALENMGFIVLRNEHRFIKKDTNQLAIIGVDSWGHKPFKQYGDIRKASKGIKDFSIVLSHDPTYWEEIRTLLPNSFTFSGHTHAFQFGFIYNNKPFSPIKWRYKEWYGLYQISNSFLFVSRGIGMVGFLGRMGMFPEIVTIEFIKSNE